MKRFLKKIGILLLIFYPLLWIVQVTTDYGLRNNYSTTFNEWSSIINGKINSKVIIVGSSRALKHFDPRILESKLNRTVYNLGTDGATYGFQRMKLNSYLNNNKSPEIIIQNVDVLSLSSDKKIISKEKYLPYYYSKENIKILSEFNKDIYPELLFPLYKYRGYKNEFIMGLQSYFISFKDNSEGYKGYLGSKDKWDNGFENFKNENPNIFKQNFDDGFNDFLKILEEIKGTKSKLFLIWSPEYYKLQKFEGSLLKKIKDKYNSLALLNDNVYFLDFTNDSLNFDTAFFYNFYHLNEKGATVFSKKIGDTIKTILKKKIKVEKNPTVGSRWRWNKELFIF